MKTVNGKLYVEAGERPFDPTLGGRYPAEACAPNGGFVHSRVSYRTERDGRRVAVCADCGHETNGSGWAVAS